jgi:D-alanyl-D-alanine carboxypeptidase
MKEMTAVISFGGSVKTGEETVMGAVKGRLCGALVAAALAVGSTGGPATATPSDRDALQRAMTEMVESGAGGVQVRVHDFQGDWAGSAGTRDRHGGKVSTNGRFRAGSITKMFVATVVLQLVDEGRVDLDDPVDAYLPEYGLDQRITVRMLLRHTSGLFDYTGQLNPDGTFTAGIPLVGKDYVDNLFHTYRPADLVAVSLAKPANFAPGAGWRYSNTNYVLVAQIIERLTGTPYGSQVRQRILRPLGLRDTLFPGSRPGIPGPHARGYLHYLNDGQARVADVTRVDPTWAWAAGEVISTTADLDRFVAALLAGGLLSPASLAQMRDHLPTGDGYDYGLGLLAIDFGPTCGVFEGHDGGLPGYVSMLFSSGDRQRRLEVSVTVGRVNLDDPGAARRFLAALGRLLATAACGSTQPGPLMEAKLLTGAEGRQFGFARS